MIKAPLQGRLLRPCGGSIVVCYHPLKAYQCQDRSIAFVQKRGMDVVRSLNLPCGQCVGCRLERSRQWAVRCMHEASLYKHNCFITLTYSDEHLPEDMSLDVTHFQKFMKRFRKKCSGFDNVDNDFPIRFYHAGEYGEKFGRPHYHACIFNFDFPDKYYWRRSPSGHKLYRSPTLEKLWPYGNSEIGEVTFESAAYVARYIMKKVNGKEADKHYEFINPDTGEVTWRKPEYTTMSRNPGIAYGWFEKYKSDVYPHDYVIVNGKKCRPPKFYDGKFKEIAPDEFEIIQWNREDNAKIGSFHSRPERLAVREEIQLKKLDKLKRTI